MSSADKKDTTQPGYRTLLIVAAALVILGIIGYLAKDRSQLKHQLSQMGTNQSQPSEAMRTAVKVSQLMELPDETPTLATVSDADKVRNKPFFENAQNGDRVLLYAKSGRAVLYRPSTHKIIEASTLNLSEVDHSD